MVSNDLPYFLQNKNTPKEKLSKIIITAAGKQYTYIEYIIYNIKLLLRA
jgi:hypothetical protein